MALNQVPYRRGLPSILKAVKRILILLAEFITIIEQILPPEQMTYVNALKIACEEFQANVSNPDAGDPLP